MRIEVWDSDEEGVATRVRMEAQPEAGAGGSEPLGALKPPEKHNSFDFMAG